MNYGFIYETTNLINGNEFIAGSAQAKYCPDCKKGWCK